MANEVLKVNNLNTLNTLQNHSQGKIAFCEEDKKYYIYDKDKWNETKIEINNEGAQISLYELNRNIIEQLPAFTESHWLEAEKNFLDWEVSNNHYFYLIYGKEISYFTLFQKRNKKSSEFDSLFSAVKECLLNLGEVYAFDITEDKSAIEIWVKTEEIMTCLYLFNYDKGVVTFHG